LVVGKIGIKMIGYRFKPKLSMTIATLLVMALCIKLGSWQYNKAQAKLALQQQLEQGLASSAVTLPSQIDDVEAWRYKRVKFEGVYKPKYQILLDNQVHDNVVGYQVLTPIQVAGSKKHVLVNRGWVKGNLNRKVPVINTPEGKQYLEGDVFFPLENFFTLEDTAVESIEWKGVWQHVDMKRYKKAVPFDVMPYVVRLDANSTGGGFNRHWPIPKDRVTVHLGYAYQWFGFAFTLFIIYIVLNLKRIKKES
jgi:surfeit locus 1 family protein